MQKPNTPRKAARESSEEPEEQDQGKTQIYSYDFSRLFNRRNLYDVDPRAASGMGQIQTESIQSKIPDHPVSEEGKLPGKRFQAQKPKKCIWAMKKNMAPGQTGKTNKSTTANQNQNTGINPGSEIKTGILPSLEPIGSFGTREIIPPAFIRKAQAAFILGSWAFLKRAMHAKLIRIIRQGGRGCSTLIDYQSVLEVVAYLRNGNQLPLLPSEQLSR